MLSPLRCLDLPAPPSLDGSSRSSGEVSNRERIFGLVYRQMLAIAGPAADFEDLVQTAAEQALLSLEYFDGRCDFSTWTYRICHNTLLKQNRWYRRWMKRFVFWDDSNWVEPREQDFHPNRMERDERAKRLWAAITHLSTKRRVVVVLHDLEGFDVSQIAEIISCNPLTVRSRLRDGRKLLARELRSDPYFGMGACAKETF